MTGPRVGSLCSGYEGLGLAVLGVFGGELAWVADNDPGATQILDFHLPAVKNLGDITTVDWATVEPVDILCAGFPCQDLSYAGQGAGIQIGNRSGLWFTIVDAIRVLRPSLVVLENVAAIVGRRPGLDAVAASLAEIGFDAEWDCVRASDVGAPHIRDRWFALAWPVQNPDRPAGDQRRQPAGGEAEGGRPRADAGRPDRAHAPGADSEPAADPAGGDERTTAGTGDRGVPGPAGGPRRDVPDTGGQRLEGQLGQRDPAEGRPAAAPVGHGPARGGDDPADPDGTAGGLDQPGTGPSPVQGPEVAGWPAEQPRRRDRGRRGTVPVAGPARGRGPAVDPAVGGGPARVTEPAPVGRGHDADRADPRPGEPAGAEPGPRPEAGPGRAGRRRDVADPERAGRQRPGHSGPGRRPEPPVHVPADPGIAPDGADPGTAHGFPGEGRPQRTVRPGSGGGVPADPEFCPSCGDLIGHHDAGGFCGGDCGGNCADSQWGRPDGGWNDWPDDADPVAVRFFALLASSVAAAKRLIDADTDGGGQQGQPERDCGPLGRVDGASGGDPRRRDPVGEPPADTEDDEPERAAAVAGDTPGDARPGPGPGDRVGAAQGRRGEPQRRPPRRVAAGWPSAADSGVQWGKFGPAIERWEYLTGRAAPAPTDMGRTGPRLSPRFVEWLMGLPPGWVTDVPGLSRSAQLKALGNGVVPQQAVAAVYLLAARIRETWAMAA